MDARNITIQPDAIRTLDASEIDAVAGGFFKIKRMISDVASAAKTIATKPGWTAGAIFADPIGAAKFGLSKIGSWF